MMKKEHLAAKLFTRLTWHFAGKENELFLTFDDGPNPEITPWILDTLEKYDARATFFCIGGKAEKHPDLIEQIIEKGHSIGNHGYIHMDGWVTQTERYVRNVHRATQFIDSNLFRPPYGRIRPRQVSHLKQDFNIIMWDVLPKDFDKNVTAEKCLNNMITFTESGSIIVLHDNVKTEKKLRQILPKVLAYFTQQGFVFNPIEYKRLV